MNNHKGIYVYTHTQNYVFTDSGKYYKNKYLGLCREDLPDKGLVVKPGDLTSVLVTHKEVREKQLPQAVL